MTFPPPQENQGETFVDNFSSSKRAEFSGEKSTWKMENAS